MIEKIFDKEISIIIPTKNRPLCLERLLDSLCKQDAKAKEIIIADNGSPGTIDTILRKYNSLLPLRYLKTAKSSVCAARNAGVKVSSGAIIAFLDDDCVPETDWISSIMLKFKEPGDIKAVQGNTVQASFNKDIYAEIFNSEYNNGVQNMLKKTPGYVDMVNTQNFAIDKETISGFRMPFDERLATNEDVELYWKLKRKGIKIAFSERMKIKHAPRTGLCLFLKKWFSYGFGKAQVKKLHYDFMDYYVNNAYGICSALFLLYKDISASYRISDFKKIIREKSIINVIIYFPVLFLQRLFFIFGLYLGNKIKPPAYIIPGTPSELILFVTNRCNLRCKHCFYIKELDKDKQEISELNVHKIFKSLNRDLDTICIGGGEPFANPELFNIISAMGNSAYIKNLYITTNGFYTSRITDIVERVLDSSCFDMHLLISLDGAEEKHNSLRGDTLAFKNAVETVRSLLYLRNKHNKLHVSVQTIVSQANIEELDDLVLFVKDNLKVPHLFDIIRHSSMFYQGDRINPCYGVNNLGLLLDRSQIKRLNRKVTGIYKLYAKNNILSHRDASYQIFLFNMSCHHAVGQRTFIRCTAGNSIITVFPNYDVAICEATNPIGNLIKYNFDLKKLLEEAFFKNDKLKIFRDKCRCTSPCLISSSFQNR